MFLGFLEGFFNGKIENGEWQSRIPIFCAGGRKMIFLKRRLKNTILAAFAIPAMLGFVEDAKGKAAIAEAREVYVAAQAVATEYYSNNNSRIEIPEKIAEYLASDFGMSKDELWFKTDSFDDGERHDLASDNNAAKTNRIYVMLGKKGTEDEGKVREIQYLDKTGKYIVIISAGGSAEITKIEKN